MYVDQFLFDRVFATNTSKWCAREMLLFNASRVETISGENGGTERVVPVENHVTSYESITIRYSHEKA